MTVFDVGLLTSQLSVDRELSYYCTRARKPDDDDDDDASPEDK